MFFSPFYVLNHSHCVLGFQNVGDLAQQCTRTPPVYLLTAVAANLQKVLLMPSFLSQHGVRVSISCDFAVYSSLFRALSLFPVTRVTLRFWSLPDTLESVCRALKLHPVPAQSEEACWSLVYSTFITIKLIMSPNCTKFDTALSWVPSDTPSRHGVDQMNDSRGKQRQAGIHTDRDYFL